MLTKFDPTGKSAETKLTLMKMGYLYTYSQACVCFSDLKVMFLLCFGIVNWFFGDYFIFCIAILIFLPSLGSEF